MDSSTPAPQTVRPDIDHVLYYLNHFLGDLVENKATTATMVATAHSLYLSVVLQAALDSDLNIPKIREGLTLLVNEINKALVNEDGILDKMREKAKELQKSQPIDPRLMAKMPETIQ